MSYVADAIAAGGQIKWLTAAASLRIPWHNCTSYDWTCHETD